ncbi:hypothetical protein BOO94_31095 [Pseudomonas sp. FSL W5-0299]|nr:hypothetical protein BOO94_31095 [Pseudomonas sp. FSL W5-0299]
MLANIPNYCVGWTGLIASRLTPAGDLQWTQILYSTQNPVGVSLLAMRPAQTLQNSALRPPALNSHALQRVKHQVLHQELKFEYR